MTSSHPISILLLTYNSAAHLPRCLDCLKAQTYQNFEIILIDNASQDDSLAIAKKYQGQLNLQIVEQKQNTGFAAANNLGAKMARGEWLALLNADAFPAEDWLENLLQAAGMHPGACFASRQVQADTPGLLDGEGDVYHVSGLAWRRNYGLPVYEAGAIEEIFSPCAAAALYPRQAFLDVGGFDEDYFAYHEDVDLGFRLRLSGLRCYYVPAAVVWHVGSASTGKMSDFSVYHGHRNLVWTYFKNMPPSLFWSFLPLHLSLNFYLIFSYYIKKQGHIIWCAKWDALRGLGRILRKRKQIQRLRQVSAGEIYRLMEHNWLAPRKIRKQHQRFERQMP